MRLTERETKQTTQASKTMPKKKTFLNEYSKIEPFYFEDRCSNEFSKNVKILTFKVNFLCQKKALETFAYWFSRKGYKIR